jgi:hypothetical protein
MNKMREVVFQDLFKKERKRRTLSIHEEFRRGKYFCTAENKTIFRLKDIRLFASAGEAGSWIEEKLRNEDSSRYMSVLRIYNKNTGVNFWQSKLIGSLYVMHDNAVFTVLSMQILKISVNNKAKKV